MPSLKSVSHSTFKLRNSGIPKKSETAEKGMSQVGIELAKWLKTNFSDMINRPLDANIGTEKLKAHINKMHHSEIEKLMYSMVDKKIFTPFWLTKPLIEDIFERDITDLQFEKILHTLNFDTDFQEKIIRQTERWLKEKFSQFIKKG